MNKNGNQGLVSDDSLRSAICLNFNQKNGTSVLVMDLFLCIAHTDISKPVYLTGPISSS